MAQKILIIDDDIDTLKLVGLMLQKEGYQIVAASSGKQGLEQAEKENPDLILLDIMMPEMDGYEVAKHLRANPQTTETPILMFTAKTQLDDKVSGFEAGADDYLTKPTHPAELSAHVKALLARSGRNKPPTGPLSAEKRALTVGVLGPRGGWGASTVAVNLGDALREATKAEVIVAELRPGMGTLGPDLGEPMPEAMTELLSANLAEINRQKVEDSLFAHKTGLRLLFGSVRPKEAGFRNAGDTTEAVVNWLKILAPYLVLDLGAGLTPLAQKLAPACNLLFVLAEPVSNSLAYTRMLMEDLAEIGVGKKSIQVVAVNRIRSDTQLTMSQLEDEVGQPPVVAITPMPELLYTAARLKTTVVTSRPDSLSAQQFAKLAEATLEYEKRNVKKSGALK